MEVGASLIREFYYYPADNQRNVNLRWEGIMLRASGTDQNQLESDTESYQYY